MKPLDLWKLANLLDVIAEAERRPDYARRNVHVIEAVLSCLRAGIPAGFRFDTSEPDWPVAFLELPGAGQVSWHLEQHAQAWDGHDDAEKRARCEAFVESVRRGA